MLNLQWLWGLLWAAVQKWWRRDPGMWDALALLDAEMS